MPNSHSTLQHIPLVHLSSLLYPTSERTNPEVPATRARITQPSALEKEMLQKTSTSSTTRLYLNDQMLSGVYHEYQSSILWLSYHKSL